MPLQKADESGARLQQGNTTHPRQLSPPPIPVANAALFAAPRFPGEDGGRSLAEMAQRDLDAALRLLADRAQYITGSSGAAIALRRNGKNDMLCRASVGSSAPELGALLSTEFGLSGESVRTRQALRCDDAERDARVNREVCRELGIASVVVMPVVNDDQVLGVFELFSPQVNAFGERDLSALRRLSEMVETAVKLAQAAENLPERLAKDKASGAAAIPAVPAAAKVAEAPLIETEPEYQEVVIEVPPKVTPEVLSEEGAAEGTVVEPSVLATTQTNVQTDESPNEQVEANVADLAPHVQAPRPGPAEPPSAPKKPLFWSAATSTISETGKPAEPDQSHVPPGLRSLRKCVACGFPVSARRTLCVECEEKKWRGQLRVPQLPHIQKPSAPSAPLPAARAAIAAQSSAAAAPAPLRAVPPPPTAIAAPPVPKQDAPKSEASEIKGTSAQPIPPHSVNPSIADTKPAPAPQNSAPEFVLTAAMQPSQSWLAANKYAIGVLLAVAAVVVAIILLR